MIQVIAAGVWAVVVFAAANIFAPSLLGGDEPKGGAPEKVELVSVTIQSNVPAIKGGEVRGFIITNLVIDFDMSAVQGDDTRVKQFVKHEVFKTVYGSSGDAFVKPKKEDLVKFANVLLPSIDKRLGKGAVQDLLVQEMYFVPLSFLRGKRFNKFLAGRLKKKKKKQK